MSEPLFKNLADYDDDSESDYEDTYQVKSRQTSKWFYLAYEDEIKLSLQVQVSDWMKPIVKERRAALQKAEPQEDAEELKRRMRRSMFFEQLEEGGKRVSVSHKKKYLDSMMATVNFIREQISIPLEQQYAKELRTDWLKIAEEFEKMTKTLQRYLKLATVKTKKAPNFFIKFCADFNDKVIEFNKDKKYGKCLAKQQKKACTSFLNRLRNHNSQYKKQIKVYRADPENFEINEDFGLEEEEELLRKMDDEDDESKPEKPKKSKWELSDDEDADTQKRWAAKRKHKVSAKARRWLRDDYVSSDDEESDNEEEDIKKKVKVKKGKAGKNRQKKAKKEVAAVVLTPKLIKTKIADIRGSRNKKQTNAEIVEELSTLLPGIKTLTVKPEVRLNLQAVVAMEIIALLCEQYTAFDSYMGLAEWKLCCLHFASVLQIAENTQLAFREFDPSDKAAARDDSIVQIRGNFASFVETLDGEMIKALQYTDPHSVDFVTRLSQEYLLLNLAERVFLYYQKQQDQRNSSRMAFRLLFHLHHRKQSDHTNLLKEQQTLIQGRNAPQKEIIHEQLDQTIEELTLLIYKSANHDLIEKTVLLHTYFKAQRNQYFEARNLLLMSNVSKNITQKEIQTQVLMNRAIAQLGLAAFRSGNLKEVNYVLSDLCSNQRMKELLAQSFTTKFGNNVDKSKRAEIEKKERSRLIPFHMHISHELLEGVYLLSAMILEIPHMSILTIESGHKKKVISRPFRRLMDTYDRRVYLGPPESTKDLIYAASCAMREGDWNASFAFASKLSLWNHLRTPEPLKKLVLQRIKEESLRTYLFSYAKYYTTISLTELETRFELSNVHSIVSKMILRGEFLAAIDEPSQCITMVHKDGAAKEQVSKLALLAWKLIDRQSYFCEYNERYFKGPESKSRFYNRQGDRKDQRKYRKKHK